MELTEEVTKLHQFEKLWQSGEVFTDWKISPIFKRGNMEATPA